MNPPTEQLIRDYLNRVSVAARDQLSPEDRRAFLARMHEVIERSSGGPRASRARVRKTLSGFGDPATLVDHERARLAAVRGQPLPEPAAQPTGPQRRRGSRQAGLSGTAAGFVVPGPASPLDDDQALASRELSGRSPAAQPSGRPPAGENPIQSGPGAGRWRPPGPAQPSASTQPAANGHPAQPVTLPPSGRPGRPERPEWPSAAPAGPREDELSASRPDVGPDMAPDMDGPGRPRQRDLSGPQQQDGRRPAPAAAAAPGVLARRVGSVAVTRPLEFSAIVILGLGGLIFPPAWLIGALVALLSRTWDFRDKWIGLGGPLLLVIVGSLAAVALGGEHASAGRYVHEAWTSGSYLSRIGGVLGAAYLGWRLRKGPRTPASPPWNRPHRIG